MKKKIFITIGLIGLVGVGIVLYIMFKPHRDVQSSPVDYQITASALVNESLKDADAANSKYLAEDGDSKIIAISGVVASMDYDFNNNLVVLLKNKEDDAGVKCTFMKSTNKNGQSLSLGKGVTIKGVYRAAASYDEDFEEYEDVIIEESDIINN